MSGKRGLVLILFMIFQAFIMTGMYDYNSNQPYPDTSMTTTAQSNNQNYSANSHLLDHDIQKIKYNSWGSQQGEFEVATSLSTSYSYIEDMNYKNGRLINLDNQVSVNGFVPIHSSVVSIIHPSAGDPYTGNIFQLFKLYEFNQGTWQVLDNWYDFEINSRYHAGEQHDLPSTLDFTLQQINRTETTFEPSGAERYKYLHTGREGNYLNSGYYTPYKVVNTETPSKALNTRFWLMTDQMTPDREYVLEISSQVYASSKIGDPNQLNVYNEVEYIYLRLPGFDQSRSTVYTSSPPTSQGSTSWTYIFFFSSLIMYIVSFSYTIRSNSNAESESSSVSDDVAHCPTHRNLTLKDGECIFCGPIEKNTTSDPLSTVEKILFFLVGMALISAYLQFL